MGGNGKVLSEFPRVAALGSRPVVQGICMQVVISCSCGRSGPMLVIYLPQAAVAVTCPACQTSFRIGAFNWDLQMQYPDVKFQTAQPNVVIPSGLNVPQS
jgi:hypothetical protein